MILHTTDQGAGPPVVLLHGLFGRSQNFATLARGLAPRFRVLSLDLRNHGASPHAPGMAYPVMAQDVVETLAAHGCGPVRLLGHSMGGKVAMMVALLHPGIISRLIVADIAPVAYAHHNRAVAQALLALALAPGLTRAGAQAALAPAVPDPAVRGFLLQNLDFGAAPAWRIGLADIADGICDIEGWPALPAGARFGGPALFLAGGRSDYVTAAHHAATRALFPQARFESLAEAGHWLHADQPDLFAAQVAGFFGEIEASPGAVPE